MKANQPESSLSVKWTDKPSRFINDSWVVNATIIFNMKLKNALFLFPCVFMVY